MMLSSESVKEPTRTAVYSNMAVFLEKPFSSHAMHVSLESIKLFTGDIPPTASLFSFYLRPVKTIGRELTHAGVEKGKMDKNKSI